ncbi:hypothetical protein NHL50_19505 [Acidimicrobiia bacterium EGI L10123]|uniref:hypothetical protein n=1 Tax=Salinilacustrithrix flava TaxID=2957203 RepID=UPI003D7C2262|nr:hypothetical protein [Acidimicrobiia bacterium EGI L10123]
MHHDDGTDLPAAARSAAGGVLGGTDALARSLERWAADALVDEAARQRTRQRWLRVQAEEEASTIGALVDLAERGRPVVLDVGEHRVRGAIVGVGADFLALRSERDQDVLVRTEAVEVVRAEPGGRAVIGDRTVLVEVALDAVVGPLAADRPEVLIRTRSGQVVRGELRSAGTDVVRLRSDGDPPAPVWIPLAAVAVLVLQP